MSDILIKNMKMPIGCDGRGTSCPLLQWGLGDVYCRITHRHFDSIEDSFKYAKERPADCPLIEVPSADAVEVKHGEWCEFMEDPINQRNYGGQTGYYECSNCKFVEDYRPNFCPHCGTDMRGRT